MSDREEFIEFLKKFNIQYHSKEHDYDDNFYEDEIVIIAKDSDKIEGYGGFFCSIKFDENDNFTKLGIWE